MTSPDDPTSGGAPIVVLVGAFDTKREPLDRLRAELATYGCSVHRVDFGVAPHESDGETAPEQLADLAGTTMAEVRASGRAGALDLMAIGVRRRLAQLHQGRQLDAVLFAGGSGAGTVFSAAATALPFGIPKVLVSTVVAGDTRGYLHGQDAVLFYPVADVEGDNSILRSVLARAAAATAALARVALPGAGSGAATTTVAATMFGITTPCVAQARALLEARGMELVAFHANGTGGATLERLVGEGRFDAVLDITTTELADLVAGGTLSAGESRLTAAARHGVPQVIVPGALDTVNFGAPDTVPAALRGRRLHAHNPHVTLMRTDVQESARLGELVGKRANLAPETTTVVLPLGGLSELDQPGMPFWWPEADEAFRVSLTATLDPAVRLVESPGHVNAPELAEVLVTELARLLGAA